MVATSASRVALSCEPTSMSTFSSSKRRTADLVDSAGSARASGRFESIKTAVKGTIRAGRRSAADEETIATKPDVTVTTAGRLKTGQYAHPHAPCDLVPRWRDCADDEEPGDVLKEFYGPLLVRLVRDREAARNRAGRSRPEIRRLNHVSSPLIGV
jgi:hypothetical protein